MLNYTKKLTALLLAACCLTASLTGCISTRPVPGVGRDTSADTSDTKDTGNTSDSTDTTADSTEDTTADTTEPEDTTAPPPPQEYRVSVLAVGDNIIHEAVFTDAKNRAADGAEYDFVPMYAPLADMIAAADLAFVNHETPLAGKEYGISGYPTFNSPREAAEALVEVGFDVISLANNHLFDKHNEGARATVKYVQSLPVAQIGAYLNKEDYENIRVTEVNGIRIAWVAFTNESNYAYNPAVHDVIMPMFTDENKVRAHVAAAKAVSDFVIVSAHFGTDGIDSCTDLQKRQARLLAEAGADVIIGHHPHILQPVEWLSTSDGSRTLVAYSLGNFLSTQHYAKWMVGGMLTFDIVMKDGVCTVETPILNPIVTHYTINRDGLQVYPLEEYTEDLAQTHGTLYYSPAFSLAWIYKHVMSIVADEFLPTYFE